MNGWLIALTAIVIWMVLVYYLFKRGIVKKEGKIALFGPALMLKTDRGKTFIKRIGKSKIWKAYGYGGLVLSFLIMFLVFILLLWQAVIVMTIPPSRAPSPVEALGIPGINPIIPLWYGILGLVVAIVCHEFSHGFLVAFHRMKIRSIGILLFILPIGAFVEPDEDELANAKRIKRMHVYAAGPTTNIVLAIVFLILFSAMVSAVTPAHDGLYVSFVYPTENNNVFHTGDIIESINGTGIRTYNNFTGVNAPLPGKSVNVLIYSNGAMHNVSTVSGVYVLSVIQGYPASKAGIKAGWIFYEINGTIIRNENDFFSTLNKTHAGESVNITMLNKDLHPINVTATLTDKYNYYAKFASELNRASYRNKGFLGVSAMYMGITVGNPEQLKSLIANPYANAKNFNDLFRGTMLLISLPFVHLMPFPSQLESVYLVPFPGFWVLIDAAYWIFWLNLMLGLTNLLPAIPLDGGYLFSDLITHISKKLRVKNPEAISGKITAFFSITVLILIIWQFIGPRI